MDVLVEALDNDAGYRSHFFSIFANKKIELLYLGLALGTSVKNETKTKLFCYKVVTQAFTAADLQDLGKLRGYLGEDNSDKNMGYSKSIHTKVKHTHTLNLCQLSHLCT